MHIYVRAYSIAFSANCLAGLLVKFSRAWLIVGSVGYVVLIGACRRGLAVAVFTVGASSCILARLCRRVCVWVCGVSVPDVVFVGNFHFGVGWHGDAEPLLGLVDSSLAPRALARVPAHFLA